MPKLTAKLTATKVVAKQLFSTIVGDKVPGLAKDANLMVAYNRQPNTKMGGINRQAQLAAYVMDSYPVESNEQDYTGSYGSWGTLHSLLMTKFNGFKATNYFKSTLTDTISDMYGKIFRDLTSKGAAWNGTPAYVPIIVATNDPTSAKLKLATSSSPVTSVTQGKNSVVVSAHPDESTPAAGITVYETVFTAVRSGKDHVFIKGKIIIVDQNVFNYSLPASVDVVAAFNKIGKIGGTMSDSEASRLLPNTPFRNSYNHFKPLAAGSKDVALAKMGILNPSDRTASACVEAISRVQAVGDGYIVMWTVKALLAEFFSDAANTVLGTPPPASVLTTAEIAALSAAGKAAYTKANTTRMALLNAVKAKSASAKPAVIAYVNNKTPDNLYAAFAAIAKTLEGTRVSAIDGVIVGDY